MLPITPFRPLMRSAGPVVLVLLLVWTRPSAVAGQSEARFRVTEVTPLAGIERCAPSSRHAALRPVLEARTLSDTSAKPILAHLVDSLSQEAAAHPTKVEAQYLLAAALGAQADVEGGRTKIRAARALHEQLGAVFALDPAHAGAQHLLGRLHAAVRRMDSLTRWIATRLLGGGALAGASWAQARLLLESAVVGDPCVPDHHYELARLYVDIGQESAARERLERLLELPASDPLHAAVFDRARALRAELQEHRGNR
jgi:hypothetical protein